MEAATHYEHLVALEREGTACVLVLLVEALGSTPQDTGAKMIVTAAGLHTGTVGGGKVEAEAIKRAQAMLAAGETKPAFVNWTLKTDVGMTCGGSVKLYFEPHPAGGAGTAWPIWIFGAGHVVQALVPEMPGHAFLLCLTKGHASDRPVLQRALAERNFPFVGVIGSDAKAEVLRRELVAGGLPAARAGQFHCPVGLDFGSNDPREIALSIAAQLLTERDALKSKTPNPKGQTNPKD